MLNWKSVLITPLFLLSSFFLLTASADDENTNDVAYQIDTTVSGLQQPWSLSFLSQNDILITERGGTLRRVQNGSLNDEVIDGVPEVYFAGQGGLLDVIADRDFANNQRIYLSFAYGDRNGNATRLISATLNNNALVDIDVIFTASPLKKTPQHYAGRIAQMQDGSLLLTVGDGFNYREQAQKLDNHIGKIVRVMPDGTVPNDNPWAGNSAALPEIWSYGHRNMQALAIAPDGTVYEHEHGPKGGDEINLIKPGLNYGWPVITFGVDYNGASISPYTEYPGMEQPLVNWTPSIAPSGMVYYTGSQFPSWQGSLLAVSLAERSVRKIDVSNGKVNSDERIFPELNERMREIVTGPDGALYILTDGGNAKLLRISATK